MEFISFVCDYALIDPITLAYKVDCIDRGDIFTTYEDIDEDCFRINVFTNKRFISGKTILAITEVVEDYLFWE